MATPQRHRTTRYLAALAVTGVAAVLLLADQLLWGGLLAGLGAALAPP